jgi:tRNA (cmo5U34)-methyltransferase
MANKNLNIRDFNKEAGTWDTLPRIKLSEDIARAISKQIKLQPSMDVLDFGCGTGLVSLGINKKVHSITGIDTSEKMIDVFNEKILNQKIENIKTRHVNSFSANDILNIPCDLVITSMMMHHVKDIKTYIKKFFDILKINGYIAIADLDEEDGTFHENNDGIFHFGFSRSKLKDMLSSIGFQELHDVTVVNMTKPDKFCNVKTFSVFLIIGKKNCE